MSDFMKNESNRNERKFFPNKKLNALLIGVTAVVVVAVIGVMIWLKVA